MSLHPAFARWFPAVVLALALWFLPAATAESPRRGGVLRVARASDPQSMDPAVCYDTEALLLERMVFHGLVDFDEGLRIVPKQATGWTVSADRRTYVFRLRPGVKFANGREVEASDYVYTLQRIVDLKTQSPGETFFNGIVGVREFQQGKTNRVAGLRAPDRSTFEVELAASDFAFEYKLAMTFACVVAREAVEAEGNAFWLHGFGTGPYRLASWTRGIGMALERSGVSNDPDEGFLDGVEVMIGGDRGLHTMMLERGGMDFVYGIQVPDLIRLARNPATKGLVHPIELAGTDFLYLNTELPPFDLPKVRQAAMHAIDRRRLVALTAQTAVEAAGILPPLMPGFAPRKPIAYDTEAARRLLAEAGAAGTAPFDFWYTDSDPRWERLVVSIERDLRAAGFSPRLKKTNLAVLYTGMQTRRTAACAYLGWTQDYPDPSNFLDVLFSGARIQDSGGNNFSYYSNPEVDRRLAEADRVVVPEERYGRYREIEDLVLGDAPAIPLLHAAVPVLVSTRVGGVRPHPVWMLRPERWTIAESPRK